MTNENSLLILNDQGGAVLDVSHDVTACLRAQDHGHPPVICFEPGIAKREGNGSRFVTDCCGTLRAEMGDNQPAVCYAIDHVVTTGGNCTAQGPCWYEEVCPTEKAGGVHAVCFQNTGQGWWNQKDVAETLRTPCGGDSMKANLVLLKGEHYEQCEMPESMGSAKQAPIRN